MTSARDPIVTSARIVTPEEAATSPGELLMMKIALGVAQMRGAPLYIVQFAGPEHFDALGQAILEALSGGGEGVSSPPPQTQPVPRPQRRRSA